MAVVVALIVSWFTAGVPASAAERTATLVGSLQRVQIDEEDAVDELGSLAQQAEALRLTAAAPPRNQNLGADYEG